MKHSIEWHQKCLVNSKESTIRYRRELKSLQDKIDNLEKENSLLEAQINLAIKERKDGFDAEKYGINRIKL